MATKTPDTKVTAAGLTGVLTAAVLYVLGLLFKGQVPEEIGQAVTTYLPVVVALVAAYLAPHTVREEDVDDDPDELTVIDAEEPAEEAVLR